MIDNIYLNPADDFLIGLVIEGIRILFGPFITIVTLSAARLSSKMQDRVSEDPDKIGFETSEVSCTTVLGTMK